MLQMSPKKRNQRKKGSRIAAKFLVIKKKERGGKVSLRWGGAVSIVQTKDNR